MQKLVCCIVRTKKANLYLQITNLPFLFLLCNIKVFAYYHFDVMLNNYYQKIYICCWIVLVMPHTMLPLRKLNLTLPYNNFKTKKDINIRSFFPKKYYSSQVLYAKFICLSVKKRFEMWKYFFLYMSQNRGH